MGWSTATPTGQAASLQQPQPTERVTTIGPSSTITGGTQNTTQTSSQNQNTQTRETTEQFDKQGLAALMQLISELQSGGTITQRSQEAQQEKTREMIRQLLGQYTTGQAMTDAKGAMALNLQQAMEQNMPAIQRAIEGAGTSANSMQALLSQKLANDSALAASALGAEQAKSYGNTSANLMSTLAQASQPNDFVTNDLVNAFNILKGAVVTKTGSSNTTTTGRSTSNTVNSGFSFNPGSTNVENISYSQPSLTGSPATSKPAGWWDQEAYNKRYGGNTNIGGMSSSLL